MKFISFGFRSSWRLVKLFFYYLVASPFFVAKVFCWNTERLSGASFELHKVLMILFGEFWIFGKGIVDMRSVYEEQRRCFAAGPSLRDLLKNIPGQWFTLSPLESALSMMLVSERTPSFTFRICCLPFWLYLILFDESRHKEKANHGIGCALALSILFSGSSYISSKLYQKAKNILAENSSGFFYDEGSTGYHIFVTSLFKIYFDRKNVEYPEWWLGYYDIARILILNRDWFYFGDDDGSSWLLQIDDIEGSNPSGASVNELLTNKNFRAGILDKYFKVLVCGAHTLLCCVRGSRWGHAHYMAGSIIYLFDNNCVIRFRKNGYYTLDRSTRLSDRLLSCNSPFNGEPERYSGIVFFRKLPEDLINIRCVERDCRTFVMHGKEWIREIRFVDETLVITDRSLSFSPTHRTLRDTLLNAEKAEYESILDPSGTFV